MTECLYYNQCEYDCVERCDYYVPLDDSELIQKEYENILKERIEAYQSLIEEVND